MVGSDPEQSRHDFTFQVSKCPQSSIQNLAESLLPSVITKHFEVSNLSIYRNGNLVLQDVSLTTRESEILAILGPSGCGKSTLLRTL
jgi:ABC-type bacteriocin/lantibiotic exporter with double-glycine peptidase domain